MSAIFPLRAFDNNFELIAGLRYDAYDLSPKTSSIFPSESASYDSTALSPKIALTYNIDEETKFYGQYSRGFRPPNYNEIKNKSKPNENQMKTVRKLSKNKR